MNESWAAYGAIIQEIRSRMSSFISCCIIIEPKTFDVEAHNLIKHVLILKADRHVWFGNPADLMLVTNFG